jgi:hypothetical protein
MKAETKYELAQKLLTPQEAELDKANAKPAGKAAAGALVALLLFLLLGGTSWAQNIVIQGQATDGYVTAQDNTTVTNFNQVCFLGSPTKSIRLLSLYVNGDTNLVDLNVFAGTQPYTVTGIINQTNLVVSSNSGIVTNQLAIIQFGVTNWIAKVLFTNQATNVFLDSGTQLGITVPTNAVLWNCNNRFTQRIPNTGPVSLGAEAFLAAQVRAPLAVRLWGLAQAGLPSAGNTNRVHATVKYSAYDQVVASP